MMLELDAVHGYYGKSHVLQGVSMTIGEGETVTFWAATAPASPPR